MAGPWEDYAGAPAGTVRQQSGEADLQGKRLQIKRDLEEIERRRGLAPYEARKSAADALTAEINAREATAKEGERKAKAARLAQGENAAAKELATVIAAAAAAKRLSQTGLFATGFGSGAARSVSEATPAGTVAGLVDTVAANTAFGRLQKMREESPTGGALGNVTEKELDLLKATIANIDPGKSDVDFQRSMDIIIDRYLDVYRKLGGDPATIQTQYKMRSGEDLPTDLIPGLAERPKAPPETGPGAPPEAATELKAGPGGKYVTEESKRAAARLQQAVEGGASREQIMALAAELGVRVQPAQVDAAIQFREKGGKGANVIPYESERPLSQQLIGAAAESPVGAYAIGAGSALTGGTLDELAGAVGGPEAEERARFARQFSQTENPVASMLGEVTGGALASIPAIRGARMALPGVSATRAAIAGEAALGAVTGAGEANEGSRLGGAAQGALLGTAAGAVPGAIARVASPRTPEAVRVMRRAGVRDMSAGQVLGAPELEAGAAGVLPVGGDIALRAQRNAFDQFQDAYVNDALKHIGAELPAGLKPTKRMADAQKAFDDAYTGARSNMQVVPDADMWRDIADFRARLGSDEFSEDAAKRLEKLLRDQIQRRIQGPVGGEEYKSLTSLLGKRRAAFSKQQNAEMADGVGDLQKIIDNAARRHSAPEAVAAMDRADAGYAILTRAEEAARALGNAPGEFTPQQALGAVRKGDLTARNRAYVRGDARGQQLAEAGVEALGKAPPTTPSRIERGLGFSGSVLGAPISLPINAALGIANAPGVRQMLNTTIAGERPTAAQALAEMIRRNPEYLGALAGGPTLQGLREQPAGWADLRRRYGTEAPSELGWSDGGGY